MNRVDFFITGHPYAAHLGATAYSELDLMGTYSMQFSSFFSATFTAYIKMEILFH